MQSASADQGLDGIIPSYPPPFFSPQNDRQDEGVGTTCLSYLNVHTSLVADSGSDRRTMGSETDPLDLEYDETYTDTAN